MRARWLTWHLPRCCCRHHALLSERAALLQRHHLRSWRSNSCHAPPMQLEIPPRASGTIRSSLSTPPQMLEHVLNHESCTVAPHLVADTVARDAIRHLHHHARNLRARNERKFGLVLVFPLWHDSIHSPCCKGALPLHFTAGAQLKRPWELWPFHPDRDGYRTGVPRGGTGCSCPLPAARCSVPSRCRPPPPHTHTPLALICRASGKFNEALVTWTRMEPGASFGCGKSLARRRTPVPSSLRASPRPSHTIARMASCFFKLSSARLLCKLAAMRYVAG